MSPVLLVIYIIRSPETCVIGVNMMYALLKLILVEKVLELATPTTSLMANCGH